MSIMSNSIRSSGSYRQNSLHEKLHSTPSVEEKVKFAGDDSKDRLYEPKQNKKMVRVLTVVIYIFSVSLAAIMLSLYYVFFWNPKGPHYLAHKIDMAQESVGLRDDDNVTNRNTTAPHRCLENLGRFHDIAHKLRRDTCKYAGIDDGVCDMFDFDKELQPVVKIVTKKKRRRRRMSPLFSLIAFMH